MSEIIDVKLDDILVPDDREREVKEDVVRLYAWRLRKGRTLQTIEVRRTPNGKRPFTLVSGAHRLAAYKAVGMEKTYAVLFEGDKDEAKEAEIGENLFRNELSALERIYNVAEYRRLFEKSHGKVVPGNPNFNNSAKLAELDVMGNAEGSEDARFFDRVLERLNLSRRTAARLCSIAKRLQPALRQVLTGSVLEDNQNVIERLSGLEPDMQIAYAKALAANGCDIAAADEAFNPKPKMSRDARAYEGLCDGWTRTNEKVRRKFIADYLPAIADAVTADPAMLAAFVSRNRDALEDALAAVPKDS